MKEKIPISPKLLMTLFLSMFYISAFTFGGGYAAIPLIQSQVVVNHGWLTMSEFTDLVTIAEMTPGPIAINSATFVGIRIAGLPGAVIATFGCIIPSLFIVSLLAFVYNRCKNLSLLQSVLASLRPAVVALIASAGLSILLQAAFSGSSVSGQQLNLFGLCLFAAAFFALRKFKINPVLVLLSCGLCGLVFGILR